MRRLAIERVERSHRKINPNIRRAGPGGKLIDLGDRTKPRFENFEYRGRPEEPLRIAEPFVIAARLLHDLHRLVQQRDRLTRDQVQKIERVVPREHEPHVRRYKVR